MKAALRSNWLAVRSVYRKLFRLMECFVIVLVHLVLISCTTVFPGSTETRAEPTPLPDEYFCDIVPRKVVSSALDFDVYTTGYSHSNIPDSSISWECRLTSLDERGFEKGAVLIEYTSGDWWYVGSTKYWSPANTSAPQDATLNVDSVTLPGHEGQGWVIGRDENFDDRGMFVWRYPNGHHLVLRIIHNGEPRPDSIPQGLQELAVTIMDKIPPIAAGPDIPYTVYPENKTTAAVDN